VTSAFKFQQPFLPPQSPAITHQLSIAANYAVTGNNNGNGISAIRSSHGTGPSGIGPASGIASLQSLRASMNQWKARQTSVELHVGDWKFTPPATIDRAAAQSDLRDHFEHDPFLPTEE